MAQSRAKKSRMKQVREGGKDVEVQRKDWHGVNPILRKTPTFVERRRRIEQKHKRRWNRSEWGDGSIFLIHLGEIGLSGNNINA